MKLRNWILVALVILVAVAAVWGLLTWKEYNATYITIGDEIYFRDIQELDLSGRPVEDLPALTEKLLELELLKVLNLRDTGLTIWEYDQLTQVLPGCKILWSVPFQEDVYPEDTTHLTITSLTMEQVLQLDYLPDLKQVDASGCQDLDALLALRRRRPECQVLYSVSIGGIAWENTAAELTLAAGDVPELLENISHLDLLTQVEISGLVPKEHCAAMSGLMKTYPNTRFQWSFLLLGVETSSTAAQVDISGIPLESTAPVEEMLDCFYNLETMDMCGCGISNEEMDALRQRHPDTLFVWLVQVGRITLRTDITAFIPFKYGYLPEANGYGPNSVLFEGETENLKYCSEMVCLDLGHMWISDYSFLYGMPKLQYLILGDTDGTDFTPLASLTELIYLELFMTEFSDTQVLLGMTKLRDLNICHTKVSDPGALLQMPQLERLWISHCELTEEEIALLSDTLVDTRVEAHLRHSTDGGWHKGELYYKMRDLLGMFYMD